VLSLSLVMVLPGALSDAAVAKTITIRVLVIPVTVTVKDVPPKTVNRGMFTKGDTITRTATLRNAVPQFGKPKGARVGRSHGVTIALSSQTARSDGVAWLPEGTVHTHGVGAISLNPKVAVVGGTGIYAGATGVAEFSHLADGNTLSIVRLRLP